MPRATCSRRDMVGQRSLWRYVGLVAILLLLLNALPQTSVAAPPDTPTATESVPAEPPTATATVGEAAVPSDTATETAVPAATDTETAVATDTPKPTRTPTSTDTAANGGITVVSHLCRQSVGSTDAL